MQQLTREQILAADDLELSDPIEVPEWGGTIRVRTMSAEWRDRMELRAVDKREALSEQYPDGKFPMEELLSNVRAETVAACACDDTGQLLFTPADVEALGRKSAKALDRVFAVAKDLNAITDEDVQELAGNS